MPIRNSPFTPSKWLASETAADTEKPAKDLCDATFAANCVRRAQQRSAGEQGEGIAVGIARLAENANSDEIGHDRAPKFVTLPIFLAKHIVETKAGHFDNFQARGS
jgi:hypothetical protein